MATDTASRIAPYVEQLFEDESAQKNLRRGADKLQAAYRRSQKRRVKATTDRKLRNQLKAASHSIGEGVGAVLSGPQKQKKRHRRRLLMLLALGAIGGGVALALDEDRRSEMFESASPAGQATDGSRA